MTVEDMERSRDQAIAEAEALLHQTSYHDECFAGKMAAAAAHATLASIWQARIDAATGTPQERHDAVMEAVRPLAHHYDSGFACGALRPEMAALADAYRRAVD